MLLFYPKFQSTRLCKTEKFSSLYITHLLRFRLNETRKQCCNYKRKSQSCRIHVLCTPYLLNSTRERYEKEKKLENQLFHSLKAPNEKNNWCGTNHHLFSCKSYSMWMLCNLANHQHRIRNQKRSLFLSKLTIHTYVISHTCLHISFTILHIKYTDNT